MEISDHDVAFARSQIGRQLTDLRNCDDREGVDVLGPRCLGFISALAVVGVITQHEYMRISTLANNAWAYAAKDTRR
ncbi:hypothetical protein [Stutzerimonas stutzeri]|uniref:Uncharacterized protein n=1 Tax=Stutzerimonas stutzeri KOS6 TaxID=1218352 RepID=A0A061JJU7_STUST|nr:hypothetical protein [Stutzerimonas stutzeri]EWC39586.1 hypothetical protein B597_019540 [Stutzerimonas stutzeri KOS6]